jgi:hypothetical protein
VPAVFPWDRRPGIERRPALDLVIVQGDPESAYGRYAIARSSRLVDTARLAVSLVDEHARVAFVGLRGADRRCVIPLAPVAGRDSRRALVARIAAAVDGCCAHYPSALGSAVDALTGGDTDYGWPPYRVPGRTAGVLFLGTGRPTIDPHRIADRQQLDELLAPNGICDLLAERGCPVFTIGIGGAARDDEAAAVLRDMAEVTGGRSFVATTLDELRAACSAVVAELGGTRKEEV